MVGSPFAVPLFRAIELWTRAYRRPPRRDPRRIQCNRSRVPSKFLTRHLCLVPDPPLRDDEHGSSCVYIPQRGVQWKQGVVIHMTLYTSLLYNTTPIHCTRLCRVSSVEFPKRKEIPLEVCLGRSWCGNSSYRSLLTDICIDSQ